MAQDNSGIAFIGAAVILAIAIVGSALLLSTSLDRASGQLERAVANLSAFKPAAVPSPSRRPNKPDPSKVYEVAVGEAPFRGPKDAQVTVVEFSDFQ